MKQIKTLLTILLLILAIAASAQQKIRSFEWYSFDTDTLTNDTTLNYAYGNLAEGVYDLSWQVNLTNISDTTTVAINLQLSNCQSCSDWSTYATYNASGTSDTTFVVPNFPGLRARVQCVGSTTQATKVNNHVRWVRRKE